MTTEQTPIHTADIVLLQERAGKLSILLIKRRGWPYTNMWALPGGHRNPGEAIEATASRELHEETNIEDLNLNLIGTFDKEGRDPRGNYVSTAFLVHLADCVTITPQAGDDAKEVAWFALDELPLLAFDHAEIIEYTRMILSVQAGAALLAAAMRDPAPIINLSTFWDFMKVVEACGSQLTDGEKASPLYQEHLTCYDRIYRLQNDITPVGEGEMWSLGEPLIEALAAYAEQTMPLLPFLLRHCEASQRESFLREFEHVLSRVVQEIEEVPGGSRVQLALATFKQFQNATTKKREQAAMLYNQALDLYDQHRYEECLALLDQAHHLDPGNAYVYYTRGNARYEMKDYRGAAADFAWALRCAPYFCDAMINLGNTYAILKAYAKSLVQYDRAARVAPKNGHIFFNRANVLAEMGRLPEAIESFSRAIELMPAFAGSYLNRGNTLSRVGKHQEALADYHQALERAPDDSNIAWTIAWAHFGRERLTAEVVQDLERIAQLDPGHYSSSCCLAVVALQRGDLESMQVHLQRSVGLAPEEWDSHFWIGVLAALRGEMEMAQQAIEASLALGLPPLLLIPLSWLEMQVPGFFLEYARPLLQQFDFPVCHCTISVGGMAYREPGREN